MTPNSAPLLGFGVSGASSLLSALPPLSLYIHIPWCVKKCPYCDFNSHEIKEGASFPGTRESRITIVKQAGEADSRIRVGADNQRIGDGTIDVDLEARYIDALIADLDATLPKVWGRRLSTIFFGGGTPSVFSANGIDAILAAVRARLPLNADAEITMEANPGTFESEKFKGYREAGVNRLSIGIQSFNPRHLKALGRIHDGDEARRAIGIAQQHFDNINLDLMYALPGQTLDECAADVDTALSFGTNHLSLYHLTLEPNTLFHAQPPQLPDDDLSADMQELIDARLHAGGYTHYETSAYAKPGRECQHNLNYWQFGDYLGIGAGAHAKISFPDAITREARFKQPKAFMESALGGDKRVGNAIQELKTVTRTELPFEFMMNALRLTDGFAATLFTERTGLPIHVIARELDEAEAKGLITRDLQRIAPTVKGRQYLNDLLQLFLI